MTEIAVQISNDERKTTLGVVQHQTWDSKTRMRRALKALAKCWGGALIAVLIPLVHFVAVPSLLIAGPIAFFWCLNQQEIILGGHGQCPSCSKEFKIVRMKVRWPASDVCNHCRAQVRIVRVGSRAGT